MSSISLSHRWLLFPSGPNDDSVANQEMQEEKSQDTPTSGEIFGWVALIFLSSLAFILCMASCRHFLFYLQQRNRQRQQMKKREETLKLRMSKSLVTKKVLKHASVKNEISVAKSTTDADDEEVSVEEENDHNNKETNIVDPAPLDDRAICSICLERFEVGEKVSWSKTAECNHVFHHECISPWLQKNEYCPCCRCQYLMDESRICIKCGEANLCQSPNNCFGTLKMRAKSSRTHPAMQEKAEDNSEIIRSRYIFCAEHGLVLPDDKNVDIQKEKSASNEDQRMYITTLGANYGTDDHIEHSSGLERNENNIEDGFFCPAVESNTSDTDEI